MDDDKTLKPLKPKPVQLDQELLSSESIPKERRNMVNTKSVENVKIVIGFLADISNVIHEVTAADSAGGKDISIIEYTKFIPPAMHLPSVIKAIAEVPAELADDITAEELEELKAEIGSSLFMVDNSKLHLAVDDALDIVNGLKNFINKYFIQS